MLLGMDFMHARRVWVSYSSERVFIQPANPVAAQHGVQTASRSSRVGPAAPVDPDAFSALNRTDLDDQNSLDDLLTRHPELSTHTHITYSPQIEVRQRARLQMPPLQ